MYRGSQFHRLDIPYTISVDAINSPAIKRIRKVKQMAKGRPKKKKCEVLAVLNVRVPQDVKKICVKWGKDKGKRIAAAIRAEKEKNG